MPDERFWRSTVNDQPSVIVRILQPLNIRLRIRGSRSWNHLPCTILCMVRLQLCDFSTSRFHFCPASFCYYAQRFDVEQPCLFLARCFLSFLYVTGLDFLQFSCTTQSISCSFAILASCLTVSARFYS